VQCPRTIDDAVFPAEAELRELTSAMASFGLRSTASDSNEAFIDWLEAQVSQIDGVEDARAGDPASAMAAAADGR
jgi:hypothetical protein